jgi:hypothetical protein
MTEHNITYSLNEESNGDSVAVTYNDLLQQVDMLEITQTNASMDDYIALEINYQTNFTKKELGRIADYYEISKRKKKKAALITDIVLYEKDPENLPIVHQRKKLWSYIQEIKEDKYLSKFLILD